MAGSDKLSGVAHPGSGRAAPQPSAQRAKGVSAPRPKGDAEKEGFRPDIEGLRGIAVTLVVLFHAGLLSAASVQLTGGFIGVDLFFVVSGYLITGLLIRERERNGRISFSRFYARRVRRIMPAAAVTLLICLPIANSLVTLVDRSSVMQDAASAALSIANIRFQLTTDYFNPVNYSPFLHFWSLGVEEQFYFVWPAIMAVAAWKAPRIGSGLALALIVAVSLVASIVVSNDNATNAFYMLPTRAWQLASGGLLAAWTGSLESLPRFLRSTFGAILSVAGWAALAVLLAAAYLIDSQTTLYPGTAAIWPTLAGVILLGSGPRPFGPGLILRLPPIRFLGKISYSLYLWHWPILILGGLWLAGPMGSLTPAQALALAAVAVPVAWVSWFIVEEPFRRGRIPLPRPSRVVVIGVAVMLVVAMVGEMLDFGAQAALAAIDGPDATPTAEVTAEATPTPTPYASQPTLAPSQTPTPVPDMTPALTYAPVPTTSGYAVANLSPALGKAAKDFEQPWNDNCLGWRQTTVPSTSSKCTYGNPSGDFTVVFIGDSHASALFPGVNEVAKAHGWKLIPYLKINCPFLDLADLVYHGPPEQPYPECMTWNQVVLKRVKILKPDLVIVSLSRWIWTASKASQTVASEAASLVRMIKQFPAGTKTVIIQDPPLPTNVDVPSCLSANLTDWRKCSYSRSLGFSGMGARESREVAATGAGLIVLTDQVCPGSGACPVVINNMIVWRDQHHFTATFARSLGPAIDEQLVKILVGWEKAAASPTAGLSPGPSQSPAP
jgi:peptidoglycan/LPS O-acetylase OafA/YrhL